MLTCRQHLPRDRRCGVELMTRWERKKNMNICRFKSLRDGYDSIWITGQSMDNFFVAFYGIMGHVPMVYPKGQSWHSKRHLAIYIWPYMRVKVPTYVYFCVMNASEITGRAKYELYELYCAPEHLNTCRAGHLDWSIARMKTLLIQTRKMGHIRCWQWTWHMWSEIKYLHSLHGFRHGLDDALLDHDTRLGATLEAFFRRPLGA